MDALTFLDKAAAQKPQSVYALYGDEEFLKREVLAALVPILLGDADSSFAMTTLTGDAAVWRTIRDELHTLPFLAPRRVIVIEPADPFVTANRSTLERYVTAPAPNGVLVLVVKTFAANTKLAKALPDAAKIECKAISPGRLPEWCMRRARGRYGKLLEPAAAELLVDLAGETLGLLDRELAKLTDAMGPAEAIQPEDVQRLVGDSRAANVFRILDAIGESKTGEALTVLAKLFAAAKTESEQRNAALETMAPLGAQLRRLAQAGRLARDGTPLSAAIVKAGVPNFPAAKQSAERAIRHLGLRRLDRLYEWLIELDSGLKGGSPLPPRTQLERFIVQLARPREG